MLATLASGRRAGTLKARRRVRKVVWAEPGGRRRRRRPVLAGALCYRLGSLEGVTFVATLALDGEEHVVAGQIAKRVGQAAPVVVDDEAGGVGGRGAAQDLSARSFRVGGGCLTVAAFPVTCNSLARE